MSHLFPSEMQVLDEFYDYHAENSISNWLLVDFFRLMQVDFSETWSLLCRIVTKSEFWARPESRASVEELDLREVMPFSPLVPLI